MVTIAGANSGGLLSRLNGLSLFVPVSQLEKKGENERWTEQVIQANATAERAAVHCDPTFLCSCRTWSPSLLDARWALPCWRLLGQAAKWSVQW